MLFNSGNSILETFVFCLCFFQMVLNSCANDVCLIGNEQTSFKFQNKVYVIRNIRKTNRSLYFSPCSTGDLGKYGCDKNSIACITPHNGRNVLNAGTAFIVDTDNAGIRSIGGAKCTDSKNFTISVRLECNKNSTFSPQLNFMDDCNFKINMMESDCSPDCTALTDGYIIDLRKLTQPLFVEESGRKFHLAICGTNKNCSQGTNCEKQSGFEIPLSGTPVIHRSIDNLVYVTGSFGKAGFEVDIHCSWGTELDRLAIHSVQGKRRKFTLHSKYGCVKLKQDCVVDNMFGLRYNLSNLYRKDGLWRVEDYPNGTLLLNLCGTLYLGEEAANCTDTLSQICLRSNGTYSSRGSSVLLKEVDLNMQAVISDGMVCENDKTLNYKTVIKFQCWRTEEGPMFVESDPCTIYLQWKTPASCAYHYTIGTGDCYVSDEIETRKLTDIARTETIKTANGNLTYNICGTIDSACGPYEGNVSACLSKPDGDVVIGWVNKKIISTNQTLMLHLEGESCNSKKKSGVIVNFFCSKSTSRNDSVRLVDDCLYNINIPTPLACTTQKHFESRCKSCIKGSCYDLSPLVRTTKNYILRDHSFPNMDFVINLCASVISEPDLLCPDSMICIRNTTELNIRNRYISLGTMSSLSVANNSLTITTTVGSTCGKELYASKIHFICSTNETGIRILSRSTCGFEFVWYTSYACPTGGCIVRDQTSDKLIDFSLSQKKSFVGNYSDGSIYTFNICQDTYEKCNKEQCYKRMLTRSLKDNSLKLFTNMKCSSNVHVTNITLRILCEPLKNNDHFTEPKIDRENCLLETDLKTNMICGNKETYFVPQDFRSDVVFKKDQGGIKPLQSSAVEVRTEKSHLYSVDEEVRLYCNIKQPDSPKTFNTTYFKSFKFPLRQREYLVVWAKEMNRSRVCHIVTFNATHNLVTVHFRTLIPCTANYFEMTFYMRCDDSTTAIHHFINNSSCMITIDYTSPETCSIFKDEKTTSAMDVVGITLGIAVLLAGAVFCIVYRKKGLKLCFEKNYREISGKDQVLIYMKNTRS